MIIIDIIELIFTAIGRQSGNSSINGNIVRRNESSRVELRANDRNTQRLRQREMAAKQGENSLTLSIDANASPDSAPERRH